ncbi:hypothetical protein FSP39_008028 [Pinctada imbricata]|uniref:EGF-like domain-containing protein n=1 Tax=Pinctada imbricata TaxID=66713 RepID=A0AA88XZJ4_PINIB|nr:hypothetical protein FSP39_008028 [Pinctada imbricata]
MKYQNILRSQQTKHNINKHLKGIRCENCDTGFEYNNSTQQCEDIDECNLGVATPCNGNALRPICNNTDGSYRCQCRPGPTRYYGPDCNSTDPAADLICADNQDGCYNNGTCQDFEKCICKAGFLGKHCELMTADDCPNLCWNNGTCVRNKTMSTPYCACPVGTLCQYSMRECQNGGVDVPKPPLTYSTCICPEGVSGDSCEVDTVNECDNAMCQNGGNCMDMPGENSSFCPFDQEPWMNCANYMQCQSKFMDKTCDRECATEDCLFDGYDCTVNIIKTCPNFTCSLLYGNGVCDMECNIPECENDGNDCLYKNETSMYFLGAIILDVKIADLSQLIENVSTEFLYLARIFPANLTSNYPARIVPRRRGSNSKADVPIIIPMNSSMGEMFYRGYYDVFNEAGCNETCWSSIQSFVNYFAASESMQTDNRYTLQAVTACMEGYYGDNCTMKCSENCKTMDNVPVCDMSDGRCTSGCINSSYVGSKCNAMCSGNCLSSVCNSDGTCNTTLNGRCKAGYMGERCDQMCMSGKYGVDCNMTCDAMCTSTCDSMTGYCQCKDGYTFKMVCIVCMDGYYGTNCSMSCNENCNMKKCNKTNGVCDKPCSKGYKGDKCEQGRSVPAVASLCMLLPEESDRHSERTGGPNPNFTESSNFWNADPLLSFRIRKHSKSSATHTLIYE